VGSRWAVDREAADIVASLAEQAYAAGEIAMDR
jgi:hypothetical protein